MTGRTRVLVAAVVAACAFVAASTADAADNVVMAGFSTTVYAGNVNNLTDTIHPISISGLGTNRIAGLDVRGADGRLYALTLPSSGTGAAKLYRLNLATHQASLVTNTSFNVASATTRLGVDFNDATDRLRVVTSDGGNARINPSGGSTNTDTNLAYALGDVNQGATPWIARAAYFNGGFFNTTLYDIDVNTDTLDTQDPANNGRLHTVGDLGFNAEQEDGGFDIGTPVPEQSLDAYTTLNPVGPIGPGLYRVNLDTGHASRVVGLEGLPDIHSLALLGPSDGGFSDGGGG